MGNVQTKTPETIASRASWTFADWLSASRAWSPRAEKLEQVIRVDGPVAGQILRTPRALAPDSEDLEEVIGVDNVVVVGEIGKAREAIRNRGAMLEFELRLDVDESARHELVGHLLDAGIELRLALRRVEARGEEVGDIEVERSWAVKKILDEPQAASVTERRCQVASRALERELVRLESLEGVGDRLLLALQAADDAN